MVAQKKRPHSLDLNAKLRAVQATELRATGAAWSDVAKACGYNCPANAFRAVSNLLEKHEEMAVETYRKLEGLRLDALFKADWTIACGYTEIDKETGNVKVIEPNLFAQDRILKIMERRAKLLGLDIKPDQEIMTAQVLIREIAAPLGDV